MRARAVERKVWAGMLQRCGNPSAENYSLYGGRGIRVCKRWCESFDAFYEDMGPRPGAGYQIDRIDNDGNYEPGNCRWATAKENSRNRRNNRRLTFRGETLTVAEWAERLKLTATVIYSRLSLGWSARRALTAPVRPEEKLLEFNGRTMSVREWAEEVGMRPNTLVCRLRYGMSVRKALTQPVKEWVRRLTFRGETKSIREWSEELGLSANAVRLRLRQGWSVERALTTPVQRRRRRA